ncbi:MAG: HetP family heterocyst commitment protein [Fischerella sp.]|nr:HetP family heterocyst commitment protein [Fischerella sp.]
MNQDIASNNSNLEKTLNSEQFDQLVEAILAGKYSWACVLMLRFAGYNPLHYIPYRTYNRLIKENSQLKRVNQKRSENLKLAKHPSDRKSDSNPGQSCLSKIKDLAYLEVVGKQKREIRGGNQDQWLTTQICEYQSIQSELKPESTQDLSFKFRDFNYNIS